MARAVKLGRVQSALGELSYPTSRQRVADELDDVTLLLADGERNLGALIGSVGVEEFESAEEVESEIHNVLPREAVGEPYQSEGEG